MIVSRRVIYSGRVQGVGFRATARALARRAGVTGWVRNLPDRRVELVVEGEPEAVGGYLEAVREAMDGYITGTNVTDETPQGFADFRIEA